MDILLATIAIWLSANFGFPASTPLPKVEIVSTQQILFKRYRALTPQAQKEVLSQEKAQETTDRRRMVVAIYDDETQTILLPEGWTGKTPAELSVLVHETVHHLQKLNHLRYECPAAREETAYQAQEKWLGLFGKTLMSEFDIDKFTLKVSTACGF